MAESQKPLTCLKKGGKISVREVMIAHASKFDVFFGLVEVYQGSNLAGDNSRQECLKAQGTIPTERPIVSSKAASYTTQLFGHTVVLPSALEQKF